MSTEAARLVDELTTLLYEVLKRWEVEGRVCEIVACGACRKKADRPSSVVHESDCPVHRLWQAMEVAEVVVKANAEEICDLEDERDNALGKLAELTRTAEWVTARCESANASIAALEAENARLAGQVAALRESLTLADEVARLTTWGIIVSDCREACEHPACLILRAIATYRKARAALAAAGGEGQRAGDNDRG